MIDEKDRQALGHHAEALLEDELLTAVFEAVYNKYLQAFLNAPRGDIDTMRVAHASIAALKDVQGALRAHLGSAKLYEAALAEKRQRDLGNLPY